MRGDKLTAQIYLVQKERVYLYHFPDDHTKANLIGPFYHETDSKGGAVSESDRGGQT